MDVVDVWALGLFCLLVFTAGFLAGAKAEVFNMAKALPKWTPIAVLFLACSLLGAYTLARIVMANT